MVQFQYIRNAVSNKDNKSQSNFPEGFSSEKLIEVFARFRIWTDDTGALERETASLDYGLRYSAIEIEVKRLLELLYKSLDDCKSCFPKQIIGT